MAEKDKPSQTLKQSTAITLAISRQITGAIRNLKLYPIDHPLSRQIVDSAFNVLRQVLAGREQFSLAVAGNVLLADGSPIKESRKEVFANFITELSKRKIAGLTFLTGLTKDELVTFLEVMNIDMEDLDPAGGIPKILLDREVTHIIATEFRLGGGGPEFESGSPVRSEGVVLSWKDVLSLLDAPDELLKQAEANPELVAGLIMKTAGSSEDLNPAVDDAWKDRAVDVLGMVAESLFAMYGKGKPSAYVEAMTKIAMSLDPKVQERLIEAKGMDASWSGVIEKIVSQFSDDHIADILAGEFDRLSLEGTSGLGGAGFGEGPGGGGLGIGAGEGYGGSGSGGYESGGPGGESGVGTGEIPIRKETPHKKPEAHARGEAAAMGAEAAAKVEEMLKKMLGDPERRAKIIDLLKERLAKRGIKSDELLKRFGEGEQEEVLVSLVKQELSKEGAISAETLVAVHGAIRSRGNIFLILEPFLEALSTESTDVKKFVLGNLREIGSELLTLARYDLLEKVVEKLLERVRDESDIEVYAKMTETLEQLALMLRDKSRRIMLVRIINVLGDSLKLFSDRPQGALLLKALGNLPEDEAIRSVADVLTREPLAGEAQRLLVAYGRPAVLPLMSILDITEDRVKRLRILDILAKIGRDSTDLIVKRLDDDRWYVRRNVCLLLAKVGDQTTMSYLLPWLKDRDARVRLEAVRGISALGKGFAEDILIGALPDKDRRVKEEVIKSLGRVGGKRTVLVLSMLLGRRSLFGRGELEEVRLTAAKALGEIKGAGAEDALRRLFNDRNPAIQEAAKESLAKLGSAIP